MAKEVEKKKETTWKLFGQSVLSKTETEGFDIDKLPRYVRRQLQKSRIPEKQYENALAVVGRGYGNTSTLWADRMSDNPEINFRVPSPPDFEAVLVELKEEVGIDALTDFSDKLFGHSNTPEILIGSIKREIEIIFEKHEERSKGSS